MPVRPAAMAAMLVASLVAGAEPQPGRQPDVPFLPTPPDVVEAMLALAGVTAADVVYDLGAGDGRIAIAAARTYRARAVGVELDPRLVAQARANVAVAGVGDLVTIVQADIFQTDISRATVVTLYLWESINERLRPKLMKELRPGSRIVSHAFGIGDWAPERAVPMRNGSIYLWRVPPRSGSI